MTQKPEDPKIENEATLDKPEKKQSRRALLAKLGLVGAAVYAAPSLLTLSDAEARSRSRSRSRSGGRKRRKKRRNRSRSRSRSRSRG